MEVLRMSNQLVKSSIIQHKSLKLRIYPTEEQFQLINQTFGCCRKLYNEHLQERNEFYIENILPIKNNATKTEINTIFRTFKPKTEKEWKEVYPYMKEIINNINDTCDIVTRILPVWNVKAGDED